jgi:hypothetical protein
MLKNVRNTQRSSTGVAVNAALALAAMLELDDI